MPDNDGNCKYPGHEGQTHDINESELRPDGTSKWGPTQEEWNEELGNKTFKTIEEVAKYLANQKPGTEVESLTVQVEASININVEDIPVGRDIEKIKEEIEGCVQNVISNTEEMWWSGGGLNVSQPTDESEWDVDTDG